MNIKEFFRKRALRDNGNITFGKIFRFEVKGIFTKNLLFNIFFVLIFLLLNVLNFNARVSKIVDEDIKKSNKARIEQLQGTMDMLLHSTVDLTMNMALQLNVQIYVNASEPRLAYSYESTISDDLRKYTLIYSYLDSIYVYSKYRDRVLTNTYTGSQKDFNDKFLLEENNKFASDSPTRITPRLKYNRFPQVISIIKPITNYTKDMEYLGCVVSNVSVLQLRKLMGSSGKEENGDIFVLNNEGTVIYSGNDEYISKNVSEIEEIKDFYENEDGYIAITNVQDSKAVVSVKNSNYYGIKYISVVPIKYRNSMLWQLITSGFDGVVVLIVFALIIAIIISWKTYLPFINIKDILALSYDKHLEKEVGEFEFIKNNIYKTVEAKNEMEKELAEKLKLISKANFYALQSQINPHFLYNTLENIKWLAINLTNGENNVSKSLLSLAKLLRISSKYNEYFVTIEEEIEYTNEYIELMKLRYENIFEVEWCIDNSILQSKIIKLCLQPIIENALQHGIRPKGEFGIIRVTGTLSDEKIIIKITDNGVGFETNKLIDINKKLSVEYMLIDDSIGIKNVNQRIKIIFGQEYGVKISNLQDEKNGSEIEISFPKVN